MTCEERGHGVTHRPLHKLVNVGRLAGLRGSGGIWHLCRRGRGDRRRLRPLRSLCPLRTLRTLRRLPRTLLGWHHRRGAHRQPDGCAVILKGGKRAGGSGLYRTTHELYNNMIAAALGR
eukprot:COSAG01_NODE_4970_length_4580_cov_209.695827_2_plen_119_part_00